MPIPDLLLYTGNTVRAALGWDSDVTGHAWRLTMALWIAIFGAWRAVMTAVLVLWACDYIIGFMLAVIHKRVNTRRLFYGLVKLIVYLVILAVAWQIHEAIPGLGIVLCGVIESSVVLTEAASVLRNTDHLGKRLGMRIPVVAQAAEYLEDEAQTRMDALSKRVETLEGVSDTLQSAVSNPPATPAPGGPVGGNPGSG